MKTFTFRLPVKKYIQKYLTTVYGETIPATMDTEIGFLVLNTLGSRISAQVSRGYNSQLFATNKADVTFTLSYHYFYLTKKEVTTQTGILLNRAFEAMFEEDLCRYVDAYYQAGKLIQDTIDQLAGHWRARQEMMASIENIDYSRQKYILKFANFHNIDLEKDITLDALIKMEYRRRKKNHKESLCRLSGVKNLFSNAVA